MRIAMIVEGFPVVSETFILHQITGLVELGHQVDIYAQDRPADEAAVHPEVEKFHLLDRTTYMDIPAESASWEISVWPPTGSTWIPGSDIPISNAGRILRALPALLRCSLHAPRITLRTLNPAEYGYQAASLSAAYRLANLCGVRRCYDVIHAHFGPVGNRFRFARELWRAPMIVTFHGYDFSVWPREQGRDVYRKLFASVDRITVNSDYAGRRLTELGCPPDKLRKLRVGVDLRRFRYQPRSPDAGEPIRILTVGRLVPKKGIGLMLRALAQVRSEYPQLRYDIIGDGGLSSKLHALIGELQLGDIVTLHGAQDGEYVRRRMAASHIFALTSLTAANGDQEGTPVSLMEAQAGGMPVLSTNHSGIPEVVLDGRTGLLAQEGNVDSIADKLRELIRRASHWPEMGFGGRDHMERHYDLNRLNRETAEMYADAIAAYSRPHQAVV